MINWGIHHHNQEYVPIGKCPSSYRRVISILQYACICTLKNGHLTVPEVYRHKFFPQIIQTSGYCLCGDSTRFSGFLPALRNIPVGAFITLHCLEVWVSVWVCVCMVPWDGMATHMDFSSYKPKKPEKSPVKLCACGQQTNQKQVFIPFHHFHVLFRFHLLSRQP